MNWMHLAVSSVVCLTICGSVAAQGARRPISEAEKAVLERALAERERALVAKERAAAAEAKARRALAEKAAALRRSLSKPGARPATPKATKTRRPGDGGPVAIPVNNADETRFALTLADETKLVGEPVGLAKVAVTTSFGTAQIPLKVIQRIEAVPNAKSVKIIFRNGDVVSGTLQATQLRFKTSYGEIRFAANELVRMQTGTSFAVPGGTRAARRPNTSPVYRRGLPPRVYPTYDGPAAPGGFLPIESGPGDFGSGGGSLGGSTSSVMKSFDSIRLTSPADPFAK